MIIIIIICVVFLARLFAVNEEKPDEVGVANKSCGSGRVTSMDAIFRGGAIFIALSLDHQIVKILIYKDGTITKACQVRVDLVSMTILTYRPIRSKGWRTSK